MPGSRDAALALTLLAGQRYTVVVRSSGDEVGEALLEIFEVP
jgi:2-succinyl-5-enolpyruvyl-6-hydroxy-3-cyclohexene-1-carboxylate synthase